MSNDVVGFIYCKRFGFLQIDRNVAASIILSIMSDS